jgi:hypothetical protein
MASGVEKQRIVAVSVITARRAALHLVKLALVKQ